MNDSRRLAFFLPNIFTALNMGCGFFGILLAVDGHFYKACMVIALGALFDSVDGRVARMTGTQSQFGEQFDSLSDLISFGVAPALIYYFKFLQGLDRPGMILALVFLLCGALRLARFNANIDKVASDYFQGIPIPGAATAVIGLILFSGVYPSIASSIVFVSIYILFYSILMISNIPFPSFKKSEWVKNNKKKTLSIIFLALISVLLKEELMLFVLVSIYVGCSIIYFLINRKRMKGVFEWNELDD